MHLKWKSKPQPVYNYHATHSENSTSLSLFLHAFYFSVLWYVHTRPVPVYWVENNMRCLYSVMCGTDRNTKWPLSLSAWKRATGPPSCRWPFRLSTSRKTIFFVARVRKENWKSFRINAVTVSVLVFTSAIPLHVLPASSGSQQSDLGLILRCYCNFYHGPGTR